MSQATISLHNPYANLPRFDAKRLPQVVRAGLAQMGLLTGDERQDSGQTALFARQLEYIYTETFDALYPELKARQLIPVDTRVPSGAESFTYRQYEKVGHAKIVHNYASDFPNAEVFGSETNQKVVSLGASYQYSIQDMRAAAMAGVPLEAKKADSARWSIESLLEDLAATGDNSTATPMLGLLNASNILSTSKVSPSGTWAAQLTAAIQSGTVGTTAQAIVGDALAMWKNVFQTTNEVARPNTLVLPTAAYSVAATTPMAPNFASSATVLSYIKEMLAPMGVTEVTSWVRCNGAGAAGADRALMYEKSPRAMGLIIPQEFEQFAPQVVGMTFIIPVHMRTGATEVRYPKHVTFMDGI